MSDKKVVLPREVVDAIDYARNEGKNNADILFDIHEGDSSRVIHDYINHVGTYDKLLSALVNGYTAEATPEEKVREYFNENADNYRKAEADTYLEGFYCGVTDAVLETLYIFGIEVKGVNV